MQRRKRNDININHERWLISYADFITLLFVFFVVMYSVSQVNETKYQALSETFDILFSDKNDTSVLSLEDSLHENSAHKTTTPSLSTLSDELSKRLNDLIEDNAISIERNELWLQISLNNRILFPLGSVVPSQQAKTLFTDIATILRGYDNPIQVEGYTDTLSINTLQFPSNWELSSARATAIVKLLIDQHISPHRLAAVGYGENHPIADNETEEGRAQNRRVVLMIGQHSRQRPLVSASLVTPADVTVSKAALEKTTTAAPLNKIEENHPSSLTPTILDNGEYLFSSDPELPTDIK